MKLGAYFLDSANSASSVGSSETGSCHFTVWAPLVDKVCVEVVSVPKGTSDQGLAQETLLPMTQDERGYWHTGPTNLLAGTQYFYQLEGEASWPDPASQFQPAGVHGPSQVVDHSRFDWTDDDWSGIALADYIIYELHIGTFTPEGTFEAAIARLPDLVALGITAVEIMPVAQFPGERNWGYDGVFPFATQNSYGGPDSLKQLVNACHHQGLAVVMDVVYNHFGPEGNYTGKFAPYLTDRYRTPWGKAMNFDDAYSDGVRWYFTENALSWLRNYHIDALRLDAVHAIYDFSAKHFLQALAEAVHTFAKTRKSPAYLIAESDLNDPRLIRPIEKGGYQLDAQWSDDFHHALHTRLTGEVIGYYSDFTSLETLAAAIKNRFVYAGQYSPFRRREHGSSALDLSSEQFVVCSQNHDQVGNRMTGDRFSTLISFEAQKLAAGITLLSPYIPLLFMGEEYGENVPFLYFVDHGDSDLLAAVRAGRKEEFRAFHSEGIPPDPGSIETFKASKLRWLPDSKTDSAPDPTASHQSGNSPAQQRLLYAFYRQLIAVRKQYKIMTPSQYPDIQTHHTNDVLYYHRKMEGGDLLCLMNFGEVNREIKLPLNGHTWTQIICSTDTQWCVPSASAAETSSKTAGLPHRLSDKATPTVAIAPLTLALYQAQDQP